MNLQQQEYVKVMTAQDSEDLEELVSSAADREMELHSWNIASDGTIVVLFFPATEWALEQRGLDIQRDAE